MSNPEKARRDLVAEVERAPLHATAKIMVLGIRGTGGEATLPPEVVAALVDDLFARARNREKLEPAISDCFQLAQLYQRQHGNPQIDEALMEVIDQLGRRLKGLDGATARSERQARSFVAGGLRPAVRASAGNAAMAASSAGGMRPWERLR